MTTRRPLVRISGRTRQLPEGDQLDTPVGSAPNQLPAGTHLGALAFVDDLGELTVLRHSPGSRPGQWWREWVSDSATTIKFHGFDGIVRAISEVGPKGDTGAQGLQGIKGDVGSPGVMGEQGIPGPKGDTGDQGLQGIQGLQGLKGDTGLTGATGTFDTGQVGSAPNQLPAGTHLGACAFEDAQGMLLVYLHTPDASPNSVWRERISDTETVLKYRGSDGVVRTRQELWT